MTNKMANKDLEESLDSDDELPYVYDETIELPAYKNDKRFDPIEFPWINYYKFLDPYRSDNEATEPSTQVINGTTSTIDTQVIRSVIENASKESKKYTDRKVIKKGVLNKQDIFCIRSVAPFSTDTTLLWFINFLIMKDMQADYNFLKSCLVADVINEKLSPVNELFINRKPHKVEIIY